MARVEVDLTNADARTLRKLAREWRETRRRWWSALAALERCAVILREDGALQPPYDKTPPHRFFEAVEENRDELRWSERQLFRITERLRALGAP